MKLFAFFCLIASTISGIDASSASSIGSDASMKGAWKLVEEQSDSMAPILEACGAPGFVARALARALNKDTLHFSADDNKVALEYKRGGSLPFKLQSDLNFRIGQPVTIPTPVGDQEGHVLKNNPDSVAFVRYGPKEGEKVEDLFELLGDQSLIYSLVHTSPEGKTTRVQRVFARAA